MQKFIFKLVVISFKPYIMKFKKLLTLSLLSVSFFTAYGQSNTFPSSGRVGIGTTSPGTLLHLQAGDTREQFRLQSGGNSSAYFDLVFALNNSTGFTSGSAYNFVFSHRKDGYFTGSSGGSSLEFYAPRIGGGYFAPLSFKSNGDVVLVSPKNATTANVGIGVNFPTAKLEVNGEVRVGIYNATELGYGSRLTLAGAKSNSDGLWMARYNVANNATELRVNIGDDKQAQDKFVVGSHYWNGGEWFPTLTVQANGQVGIGTSSPDAPLTVAGNIHAREVRVTATAGGADFVFADDYALPKLEVVAAFVKQNKHLPEIPSAAEMEANGLHLAEMNIKLLQKVEELTLYVIEQQKQMERMQREINELKTNSNHKE